MTPHEYKVWPDYYRAILEGRKKFEWRRDDRDPRPEVGDVLILREWIPDDSAPFDAGRYTGRSIHAPVTFTLRDGAFGLPEGFVVMSLGEIHAYPVRVI